MTAAKNNVLIDDHVELAQFKIHPPSVRLLPQQFCTTNHVVVLDEVTADLSRPVRIGLISKQDEHLIGQLRAFFKRPIEAYQLSMYEIRKALSIGYSRAGQTKNPHQIELKPCKKISFDASVDLLVTLNEILSYSIGLGASDIHIESYRDDVDVRIRLDGLMHQLNTPLSPDSIAQVVSRVKVLCGLDLTEHNRAQDGRLSVIYHDETGRREVHMRVSTIPSSGGEDIVLRVNRSVDQAVGLDGLGFTPEMLDTMRMLLKSPEGLILVSGPTSSGKTTTLYAMLNEIKSSSAKIMTVEDPVEQFVEKVNQKEVTQHMGFADYARAFLRQNPDVVSLGEIRDNDTAEVALRSAQTGLLVLGTLHASDTFRTLTRLEVLGQDHDLIHNSCLGILNQRLARRICPKCRTTTPPTREQIRRLRLLDPNETFWKGTGCHSCHGTGYLGRVGVFELLVFDEELVDHLTRNIPRLEVKRLKARQGMKYLFDDAMAKARSGQITLEDVLRVVPFRSLPQHQVAPSTFEFDSSKDQDGDSQP